MRMIRRSLALVALVALASSLMPLAAQESGSMEGQLLRVDPDAMTLAIQGADGAEHEFAYTEATQVTGAERGVAGLSSAAGQTVVVQYEGDPPTATSIEVRN